MSLNRNEYTRVPDVELLEVPEAIRIQRSPSDQPSLTLSSSGSICLSVDKKRHDRRKERLNTEILTSVLKSDIHQVKRLLELGASPDATCRPSRISVAHISALQGNYEILEILIRSGADITARDRNGRQPIHMASWEGNSSIISLLLSLDDLVNCPVHSEDLPSHDIECLDSWNHKHDELIRLVPDDVCEGSTPLHLACKKAHVNCARILLEMNANVHSEDINGLTPLDVSGLCYDQNQKKSNEKPIHDIVNMLIESGANMLKENLIKNRQYSSKKITTLHTAVSKCEIDLIEYLLQNGASLSTWNDDGETPIHLSIRKWCLESLKILVNWDHKMVDVKNDEGKTPLHLAVLQEWYNGVEILLEAGADVSASTNNRETVLHMAAQLGNRCLLEELLSMPDSYKILEYRNTLIHTPAFQAVINNYLPCLKILKENGADLTVTTKGNFTLLHCATSNNSPEIVEYILSDETVATEIKNVKLKDEKGGMTALHIAAKHGFIECIKHLINAGCDIYATDSKSATPLHLSAKYGCLEAIEIILKHDKNTLNSVNSSGWQPIHVAASSGHGNCVKLMLQKGADLSAKIHDRNNKKTALDIIMYCVPQPVDFIEEILDSYIQINDHSLSDPDCKVILKYSVLVPDDKSGKQLNVLNAVLNGKRLLQERFLLHPLVETFLYLKWRRLRIFFTFIMAIHVILTISLTTLAHLEYVEKNSKPIFVASALIAKCIMYAALLPIFIIEIVNASQLQRYYFLDCESLVKWSVIILSSIVGILNPKYPWGRYVTSVAVLISWIELLFLLAHFPSWGFYVLMFSRVASNVFKVLGTFTFLVLGFTFAFLILFEANIPFRNFMESLIKVIVMMLEFDYESMFETAHEVSAFSIIGRFMFATFVVLVAMVMMNLMVGLAVSDIAELEAQGKTQRLAKQTAFLSFLERFVYNTKLEKILPSCMYIMLKKRRTVPETTIIKPAQPIHSDEFVLPRILRESVLDRLWDKMGQKDDTNELSIDLLDYKIDQLAGIVHDNINNSTSTSTLTSEKTLTQNNKIILEQIMNDQKKLMYQINKLIEKK